MRTEGNPTDHFVAASAVPAAGSVDYQAGAIVSREIVKGPNGKVMLFAFAEGEGLSEHTSPFNALVQVLEGEVEVKIAGAPNQVRQGELILMPAGQPHALQAITPFKMILTMIRP